MKVGAHGNISVKLSKFYEKILSFDFRGFAIKYINKVCTTEFNPKISQNMLGAMIQFHKMV